VADAAQRLALISALPLLVDQAALGHSWGETLQLARQHHLTAYDATYLESSLRRGLPLFTLDRDLAAAARTRQVAVYPA
jgi:predicted nucleic acid-binding protein